jgi:hypothetical protein
VLIRALGPASVPQRGDPSLRRIKLIGEALESLAAETVPGEVLVRADRCTGLTGRVAAAHQSTARIATLNRERARIITTPLGVNDRPSEETQGD